MHKAFISFLFLALAGCATVQPPGPATAHLTILHWNDFHAHDTPYQVTGKDSAAGTTKKYLVGGSATMDAYLRHLGRGNEGVAAVNAGDDFQGTPISGITKGASQVALMNLLNPDVAVLGNHEFDYGINSLREVLKAARYPIIDANLYDSTTATTFRPPTLLKKIGGVLVGFIGLLPPDLDILTLKGSLAGTRMLNIDSVLSVHIPELRREGAQLIVLVSHMGIEVDTVLAARRNDIDLIVGGHSHTALFTPVKKNRTVIVQAGSYGRYLGKLELTVDLRGDSVLAYDDHLFETIPDVYPTDSTVVRTVRDFESRVSKELDEVIGTLVVDWKAGLHHETNVGDWEADVIRAYANTDIALINSGGIRKDLPAGPIRIRDVWEMNPFNNTLVTFAVDGATLLRMLEWQAAGKAELMQVSGLRFTVDASRPEGSRVTGLTVNGQPLQPERQYSIVTNNYVSGHLPELLGLRAPVKVHDTTVSDRDVLLQAIRQQRVINSKTDGRISVQQPSPGGTEQ